MSIHLQTRLFTQVSKRLLVVGTATFLLASTAGCGDDSKKMTADELAYQNADIARGGQVYDAWWLVTGALDSTVPTTTNPTYALTQGTRTGSATWQCRECHGKDYLGPDGLFSAGTAHFSGSPGLLDAVHDAASDLHDLIRDGVPGTGMAAMVDHISDADIWATVKFIKEGVVDLRPYVDLTTAKPKNGNVEAGHVRYQADCTRCHGADGKAVDFHAGTTSPPEYVGTVATEDVFLQHRIRFSRVGKVTAAGEPMPAFAELGYTMNDVMDVIAYCQTLPTE